MLIIKLIVHTNFYRHIHKFPFVPVSIDLHVNKLHRFINMINYIKLQVLRKNFQETLFLLPYNFLTF